MLDLLRIQMSLRNLLPALLEHIENWFVGKALQQKGDDNEANYLREEQPGIPAKGSPVSRTVSLRFVARNMRAFIN